MARPPLTVAVGSAAVAAVALLGGCGIAGSEAASPSTTPVVAAPTTAVPSTAAPTSAAPTTAAPTTTYAPRTPEASAQAAVERLLATWDNHDRVSAGEIATPSSVAELFTVTPRPLQFRNCSDGQPPVTCSYADLSTGGDFYEISASPAAGGHWYVEQVQLTPLP